MSLRLEIFKSPWRIFWSWPLTVGSFPSQNLLNKVRGGYWAKQFCRFDHPRFVSYNLLLSEDISAWVEGISARVDVLIIFVKSLEKESFTSSLDYMYGAAFSAKASAVLVTKLPEDISGWFERVIVQLSHDKNIVDTFLDTVADGALLFDERELQSTTVSSVARHLGELTKYKQFRLSLDTKITGNRSLTSEELSGLLNEQVANFKFEHETDEATELANIWRAIESVSPSMHFTQQQQSQRVIERVTQDGERSLQIRFLDPVQGYVLQLVKNRSYQLEVRIGREGKWLSAADFFPSVIVFEESRYEIEALTIILKSDMAPGVQSWDVAFPWYGDSSIATFQITTGEADLFEGELYVYHKSRLIQKARFECKLTDDEKSSLIEIPNKIEVVFSAVQDLSKLGRRNKFGASIFYKPSNSPGDLLGIVNSKPIDLFLFNSGLELLVNKIKESIEEALVREEDSKDLFDEKNVILLKKLAFHGNAIFVNHFREENKFDGPLQIISQEVGFIPLDFIYELPVPSKEAGLCADARNSLVRGKCGGCYDHSLSPAPFVCPFGFWAFSRVVERYSYRKKKTEDIASGYYRVIGAADTRGGTLNIFHDTIFGSTDRLDANSPGLKKNLRDSIEKNSKTFQEAQTWKEWRGFTEKKNPDSLVLVVHLNHDEIYDVDELEIGAGDLLVQNEMDVTKLGEAPPFVIIIGCEVTNVKTYGFDVSNQLMNHRAAIVVSNFTKIRGRDAGPLVMELIRVLKKEARKEAVFGRILLKLRQQLLAKGMMASLSLLAHGDADWNIKTH